MNPAPDPVSAGLVPSPAGAAPLLSVRGLGKHFPVYGRGFRRKVVGVIKAVDNVSFDLAPGESL